MKQKITLLVFGLALLSILGCKKNKENNIIGTWKQMSFMVESQNFLIVRWSFYENKTITARVYRSIDGNETLLNTIDADYSIVFKKLGYRLQITMPTDVRFEVNRVDYRGVYIIEELSRDVLRLVRIEGHNDNGDWSTGGDAFVQLEFLKD
jgi:hypothetical protein